MLDYILPQIQGTRKYYTLFGEGRGNTYLFNFCGTLVDSMPACGATTPWIWDENHSAYDPGIMEIITPSCYHGTALYYQKMGLALPLEQIIATMRNYMWSTYCNTREDKLNVISAIKATYARGDSLHVLLPAPMNRSVFV